MARTCDRLSGKPSTDYRVRVGSLRAAYRVDDDELAVHVGTSGEFYDALGRVADAD